MAGAFQVSDLHKKPFDQAFANVVVIILARKVGADHFEVQSGTHKDRGMRTPFPVNMRTHYIISLGTQGKKQGVPFHDPAQLHTHIVRRFQRPKVDKIVIGPLLTLTCILGFNANRDSKRNSKGPRLANAMKPAPQIAQATTCHERCMIHAQLRSLNANTKMNTPTVAPFCLNA